MTKTKNKNFCKLKHEAPTGKKCKNFLKHAKQPSPPKDFPNDILSPDTESSSDSDSQDMKLSKLKQKCQKKTTAGVHKYTKDKYASIASSSQQSESDAKAAGAQDSTKNVQQLILEQLQRVNSRLDKVEHRMDKEDYRTKSKNSQKLSTPMSQSCGKKSKRKTVIEHFESDSSSGENELPCLSVLRSSREVQKKVDERLHEIEGNDNGKIKSKRGGAFMQL